MTVRWLAACVAAVLFVPAMAEDCGKLISYGNVPMTHLDGHNSEFIPVQINGVPKLMLLDTGAAMTMITHATAAELKLTSTRSDTHVYDVAGGNSSQFVSAPLQIGQLRGDAVKFMLGTPYLDGFGDPKIAGLLGADILSKFDLSIDYGTHTFTLLDQNHCDGQVVYWPERPIAVVPFKLVNRTAIILTVSLNGKELKAQLDTGAYRSTLEKSRAEGRFDLVLGSADTPALGNPNDKDALPVWRHRFQTLSLAGITVNDPEIDIIPDKMSDKINDWSTGSLLDRKANSGEVVPMLLGMNVLKHLHIYIAYREKNLYITPASTPGQVK